MIGALSGSLKYCHMEELDQCCRFANIKFIFPLPIPNLDVHKHYNF
jgi:hypothetical protein